MITLIHCFANKTMSLEEAIYQALSKEIRDKVDEIQTETRKLKALQYREKLQREQDEYQNRVKKYKEKERKSNEDCLFRTLTLTCVLFFLAVISNTASYLTNDEIYIILSAIFWLYFWVSLFVFLLAKISTHL